MMSHYKNSKENDHEYKLYFKEVSMIPLLSPSQEKAIGERIRQGDREAVGELVQSNLRFVIKIAREYSGRGVPFLDLINEGNVGLIHAAWRFDPSKNVKFISYAVWWIRESMAHAVANFSAAFQLPVGIYRLLRKVEAIVRKKTSQTGRIPTLQEVSAEMNIGVHRLSSLLKFGEYVYVKRSQSKDGLMEIQMLRATGLESDPLSKVLHRQIHQVLKELSSQEEKVLKLRFGIDDEMTLQQIGNLLGLSRERIRQIELSALRKCKRKLLSFQIPKAHTERVYGHSS